MTEDVEIALLVRLYKTKTCRESKRNKDLTERLSAGGLIIRGSRRNEWYLAANAIEDIKARLDVLRSTWENDTQFLLDASRDPFNPTDWTALPALRRTAPRKPYINRRNWNAISGAGPKSSQKRLSDDKITHDWVLRIRPNNNLHAVFEDGTVKDLSEIAALWTESPIPERAWLKIKEFSGALPKCIITCENLGAFIDLPEIPNVCLVFSPGKNVGSAIKFLQMFPSSKWLHFGDLDPAGIKIALMISKKTGRPLDIYIPTFIDEYFDLKSKVKVLWDGINLNVDGLEKLRESGRGIYQERYMLDKRLHEDIARACANN